VEGGGGIKESRGGGEFKYPLPAQQFKKKKKEKNKVKIHEYNIQEPWIMTKIPNLRIHGRRN
jgi:hypothetical protein